MSFGIYMVGFIVMIIGLALGASSHARTSDVDRSRRNRTDRPGHPAGCNIHAASRSFVE